MYYEMKIFKLEYKLNVVGMQSTHTLLPKKLAELQLVERLGLDFKHYSPCYYLTHAYKLILYLKDSLYKFSMLHKSVYLHIICTYTAW